jgi:hypothetical protein
MMRRYRHTAFLVAVGLVSLVFVACVLIGFGDGTPLQVVGWTLIGVSQILLVSQMFQAGVKEGRRQEREGE